MNYYKTGKEFINNISNDMNIDILTNDDLIEFLRGYIEQNHTLSKFNIEDAESDSLYLDILIFNKIKLFTNILKNLDIKYKIKMSLINKNGILYKFYIRITDYNVLDILSKLYYPNLLKENTDIKLYNEYMNISNFYDIYLDNLNGKLQYKLPKCKFIIDNKNAIIPTKAHASDVGYDLSIISIHKQISEKITMYDTGIILIPVYGYYFEIYARSSLSKTGYILANSVGIIDGTYQSSIKVVLTKIDDSMPDIELPFKGVQIILRKMIHFELNETKHNNLEMTSRGIGGFGSTN